MKGRVDRVEAPVPDPERAETPDDVLVLAARSGDRAAISSLYERYAPVVHGLLITRLGAHDADDLTHEVFMAAIASIGALRDTSRFGPWICQAARNRAANYRRSWWRRVGAGVPDQTPAPQGPDAELKARARAVLATLRTLPEAYRDTLALRLVEGLTGPQIAQRTGMTHGSVRVNLARGMAMLRARMEEGP